MTFQARRIVALLTLALPLSLPAVAQAEPFIPGQVIAVAFDLRGVRYPHDILGAPDVLAINVLIVDGDPFRSFTTRLFDSDRMLGTYTGTQLPGGDPPRFPDFAPAYFVASTSLLTVRHPTVIDFSSFLNGTFDGRFEFTITDGRIHLPEEFRYEVFLGRAAGPSEAFGIVIAPPAPVPEPGTMLLVLTGLVSTVQCARRRMRCGSTQWRGIPASRQHSD